MTHFLQDEFLKKTLFGTTNVVSIGYTGKKSIDGFDLVSKEMIENNFNNKKEMKANIELKLFGTQSPCQS